MCIDTSLGGLRILDGTRIWFRLVGTGVGLRLWGRGISDRCWDLFGGGGSVCHGRILGATPEGELPQHFSCSGNKGRLRIDCSRSSTHLSFLFDQNDLHGPSIRRSEIDVAKKLGSIVAIPNGWMDLLAMGVMFLHKLN